MEPSAIVPLPQTVSPATAFSPTAGVAALVRVVRSVANRVDEARIVVASAPALAAAAGDCLRAAGLHAVGVAVAQEGGSRRQVLIAGLEHLGGERNSSAFVLVCDVHHPLSPAAVADRVGAAMTSGHEVVVPMLPVTDTVKTVDDLGSVLATVDRSVLRTVQYPRGFRTSTLWDLLLGSAMSPADDGDDEFGAALRADLDIGTVDGDADGFPAELPRDAHLLEAIIASRPG